MVGHQRSSPRDGQLSPEVSTPCGSYLNLVVHMCSGARRDKPRPMNTGAIICAGMGTYHKCPSSTIFQAPGGGGGQGQWEQGTRKWRRAERVHGRQQQHRGASQPALSLPGSTATPAQPASGGGCLPQPRWAVCAIQGEANQGQTSREGEGDDKGTPHQTPHQHQQPTPGCPAPLPPPPTPPHPGSPPPHPVYPCRHGGYNSAGSRTPTTPLPPSPPPREPPANN